MALKSYAPKYKDLRVRQDGERILVIEGGRAVLNLPWDAAQALSRAMMEKAKRAEEIAKASGIAMDSAILLRSGAPFGLTDNPKIMSEAKKEAESNRALRRYMPGGIKSEEQLGRPTIVVKEQS